MIQLHCRIKFHVHYLQPTIEYIDIVEYSAREFSQAKLCETLPKIAYYFSALLFIIIVCKVQRKLYSNLFTSLNKTQNNENAYIMFIWINKTIIANGTYQYALTRNFFNKRIISFVQTIPMEKEEKRLARQVIYNRLCLSKQLQ